jgi:hypothetical protein
MLILLAKLIFIIFVNKLVPLVNSRFKQIILVLQLAQMDSIIHQKLYVHSVTALANLVMSLQAIVLPVKVHYTFLVILV